MDVRGASTLKAAKWLVHGCWLLLAGCAATSHPDYQPVFQKQSVTPQQLRDIEQSLQRAGLAEAAVVVDSLGRVQLAGSYADERKVEQALAIARSVVGVDAVSQVRPQDIRLKDWEVSANKAFAAFLDDLARKSNLSVELAQRDSDQQIVVADKTLDGSMQFESGASTPTERTARFYRQVAEGLLKRGAQKADATRILIVGHTDDVGNSAQNAALSERRAHAIGRIFAEAGFPQDRIYYQGAGEVFPIGDNRTEAGRARNRRVEIVDLSDRERFEAFLSGRQPNVQHYRPQAAAEAAVPSRRSSSGAFTAAPTPAATPPARIAAAPAPARPARPAPGHPANVTASNAWPATTPGPAVAGTALHPGRDEIDFGGRPVNGSFHKVDIGKPTGSGFGFISQAFASEVPIISCAEDRPRISGDVKSLQDGQAHRPTLDYMPGAARSSWGAKVNGHYVGFTPVAVLRSGAVVSERPTFLVFRNWVDGSGARPDISSTASVNTYVGEKALLYRAFPASGPVRCVDLVIPRRFANTAPASMMLYAREGALYEADYSPSIVR